MTAPTPDPAASTLSTVAESTLALARAELRLATAEARSWLAKAGLAFGLLWLGLLFVQVFAVLLALSPILLPVRPWPSVLAMLLIALTPAVVAFIFAARELRKVKL